ncbi:UNVERIFIED_CONTAM: hypothetical protein Slati_1411700 [Sesamum latifolium]|uniref:Gag-pol polyprotein n=1 Tax=Sesamum latifolium TaxID=2727402 RepID=A0AAW2X494_9LAMI
MIVGSSVGGDSQRARKAQEERSGPRTSSNDALVITALLANYEIERVFIDSGSSADILFGEAYDQMQLGDVPLEAVDTSLYGFAGEVVHPRDMISLPMTLGTSLIRKICLLKFIGPTANRSPSEGDGPIKRSDPDERIAQRKTSDQALRGRGRPKDYK